MKMKPYNRVNGPKKTVADYLQSLNNEELQNIYNSGFFYGINIPDLMRKIQHELQRRNITTLPALFPA